MPDANVISVNTSPRGGVPKFPQPAVRVHPDGLEGDHHRGATRWSGTRRRVEPNDRTVTVVAAEDVDALNAELGTAIGAGALSENFLVRGLGPLAALAPGDRIVMEGAASRVTLRVTGQNMPCKNLLVYHPQMVRAAANKVGDSLVNRRGVLCVVERVEGDGVLAAGARVALEKA